MTRSDGCWREGALVSEGRGSWQGGSRVRDSVKGWVLGEEDPGGERRPWGGLKPRDGCSGGRGRSRGWGILGKGEARQSGAAVVRGRGLLYTMREG